MFKVKSALADGINVQGNAVGTDKLDHMFHDGYQVSDLSEEAAREQSIANEEGKFGIKTTGVHSNADVEANMIGRDFYNAAEAAILNGEDYEFDLSDYDTSLLDENLNQNTYTPELEEIVKENEERLGL